MQNMHEIIETNHRTVRPLSRRRNIYYLILKMDHTEKYRRSGCSRGFGHGAREIGELGDGDVEGGGEEYEEDHGDCWSG